MFLEIPQLGYVAIDRIVAIAPADSASIKRFLKKQPSERVIVITGGRKRASVIIMDDGHVIVTAISAQQLLADTTYQHSWPSNGNQKGGIP